MSMKKKPRGLFTSTASLLLMIGWAGGSAQAQEASAPDVVCTPTSTDAQCIAERAAVAAAAAEESDGGAIVITGSRLKSSFTSISPLQVVSAENARNFGFLDVEDLLRIGTTSVSGVQLGTNITSSAGLVTRNGAGTSAVNLRNIGADRTLVLLNGVRLGPSGNGGVPSNADVNVVPSIILQSSQTITDGASSVYGSDAVAGVVNLVVDTEYDGIEGRTSHTISQHGGRYQQRYSFKFGKKFDKGGFVFGAEYLNVEPILLNQRDFQRLPGTDRFCEQSIFVAPAAGVARVPGITIPADFDQARLCNGAQGGSIGLSGVATPGGFQNFAGRAVTAQPGGSITFTSGGVTRTVNGFVGIPLAPNFLTPSNPNQNPAFNSTSRQFREGGSGQDRATITPEQQRINIYAAGHFELVPHVEIFANVLFSNLETSNQNAVQQEFTGVPATNPFNPFGINVQPIVFFNSNGLGRNRTDRTFFRGLAGAKGDFGFLGAGNPFSTWEYEQTFAYTRSVGSQFGRNILEDNLIQSINTARVVNGQVVCGTAIPFDPSGFLTPNACVPVNLFAPNLLLNGQLTDAEAAYLIGDRSLRTINEQTVINGSVRGELPFLSLPGGKVDTSFGYEWRRDEISGNGDFLTETGGAAGFTQDRDSGGQLSQFDFFGEFGIPLLKDVFLAKTLRIEGGGRFVHSPLFRDTGVWTTRFIYEPVEGLFLRGTAGSSYRTPNANDVFLGGQSGFIGGANDLCTVPLGTDTRPQLLLDNCRAQGVDPLTLGANGTPGIQTLNAGGAGLNSERSFSYTASIGYEPKFLSVFDDYILRFNVSYINYTINGGVARPGAAQTIAGCLFSQNLESGLCSRFSRNPATGFITLVNNTPFNLNQEKSSFIDFNVSFNHSRQVFGETFDFAIFGTATRNFDSSVNTPNFTPGAAPTISNDEEEFFNPRYLVTGNFNASYAKFSFGWNTTFSTSQVNSNLGRAAPATAGVFAGLAPQDLIPARALHNVFLAYATDYGRLSFGVQNVFDRDPDLVDATLNVGATNTTGTNNSFNGRTFSVNFTAKF